jgi:hypothetical protein
LLYCAAWAYVWHARRLPSLLSALVAAVPATRAPTVASALTSASLANVSVSPPSRLRTLPPLPQARVMNLQFELELGEGDGAAELTVSTTPVARRALPTMRRRWCGDHQASHPARGDILPARGRAMDAGRWTTTRTTHRECVDASRRSPTLRVACGVLKPPGSPRTSRLSAAAGGR